MLSWKRNQKVCRFFIHHRPFYNLLPKGLLERLDNGPVLGDGGFVFALEKRGYVEAGPWTPEAVIEHPEVGSLAESRVAAFLT